MLSKSPSTRSSACVADTATARSSGPALRPASDSGRRRPMTSSNRKSRSSSGPPRNARAGSMNSRPAQSSKLVAHTRRLARRREAPGQRARRAAVDAVEGRHQPGRLEHEAHAGGDRAAHPSALHHERDDVRIRPPARPLCPRAPAAPRRAGGPPPRWPEAGASWRDVPTSVSPSLPPKGGIRAFVTGAARPSRFVNRHHGTGGGPHGPARPADPHACGTMPRRRPRTAAPPLIGVVTHELREDRAPAWAAMPGPHRARPRAGAAVAAALLHAGAAGGGRDRGRAPRPRLRRRRRRAARPRRRPAGERRPGPRPGGLRAGAASARSAPTSTASPTSTSRRCCAPPPSATCRCSASAAGCRR